MRVVATPGQDPEEVARQYNSRHWGSQPGPNGTRILDIETGAPISGFERPDRAAPVVAWFHAQKCDDALRTTGMKAAVLARRSGWVQVALRRAEWRDEPRVWIEVSPHWRFHAFAADAERGEFEDEVFGREHSSVKFRRARVVAGRLWLEVEVMSHTIYDSVEPPRVVATGWVPAHAPAGESVVWFSSRD